VYRVAHPVQRPRELPNRLRMIRHVGLLRSGRADGSALAVGSSRRHRSADRLSPGLDLCVELSNEVGPLVGQIVLLADIRAEVVEFQTAVFEQLDQLIVTDTDRSGRRRPPNVVSELQSNSLSSGSMRLQMSGHFST